MSKAKGESALILLLAAVAVIVAVVNFIVTAIAENIGVIGGLFGIAAGIFIAYYLYSEIFFRSRRFKEIKEGIKDHAENCNELNHYIEELKSSFVNIETYNYGKAEMTDDSAFNFKRKEWNKDSSSNQVIDCSLSVCKNARNQPIKYLCKYFDIAKDEESLSRFEKVLNDFTSVEEGKDAIENEREEILDSISNQIPWLIKQFSMKKLTRKLGFEEVDISDAYKPTFTFQYVSAGGNSSARVDVKLDIDNLNHLVKYLNDVIKWRKSVAGQRALMTSSLREKIKDRDDHECQSCGLGTKDEPNLLLEIDHIMPLSKGGMTKEDNLQTLCWRCNRSKGAKIVA